MLIKKKELSANLDSPAEYTFIHTAQRKTNKHALPIYFSVLACIKKQQDGFMVMLCDMSK